MNSNELGTIEAIAAAVRGRQVSAREVVSQQLDRIAGRNEPLNAFVHLDAEGALRAGEALDARIAAGDTPGALAGVPFGVKDLEDCAGMPTSQGSLLHKGEPPVDRDNPHIARARAAGAIPLGKTAAPEFGLHSITTSPAWGVTRNPWDLEKSPGGSSGGSAAAVASGMVPVATASDGGGSTRSPAAFTNLVGLKPTHGLIGRDHPSDLAVTGCVTNTVADTALWLDAVAGPTPGDRTSLPRPATVFREVIETLDVAGLVATWSADFGGLPVEPEVADIAGAAAEKLGAAAKLRWWDGEVRLPNPYWTWVAGVVIEMRAALELDGVWPDKQDLLSERVRKRVALADQYSNVDLARSARARAELEREVATLFESVDVVLTPVSTVVSLPADGPIPPVINGMDATKTGAEAHLMPANMSWMPAISVPAGFSADGFPVGLHIWCRRFRDDVALRLARIAEQTMPWPHLAPAYR